MDRKFVIALSSLAGSVFLSEAHAIGLGEITLRSTLNEPLRAEIQLVQLNDLAENELRVELASVDDFSKAGVDRDFLLNSLRFKLDLADPNKPKVVVTTLQPIREPYLNFLIEVHWPSGRLLREYTLLMDLPVYSGADDFSAPPAMDAPRSSRVVQDSAPAKEPEYEPTTPESVAEATPAPVEEPVVEQPADEPMAEERVAEEALAEDPAVASEGVSEPPAPVAQHPVSSGGFVVRRATQDEIENYYDRRASAPAASEPVVAEPAVEPSVDQEVVAQEAAGTEPASQVADEPMAEEAPEPIAAEQAPAPEAAVSDEATTEYGPTGKQDTLWRIAQRVQVDGTIHQNMIAIQRLNPDAFINGNINQLKQGKVLRLPAPQDVTSISSQEAVGEYSSQVASWESSRGKPAATGAPLDATGTAAPIADQAAPSVDGKLSLVNAGDAGSAQAASGLGDKALLAEKKALENELNVGMEELVRAERENKETSSRVQELDAQLVNAERLLELQAAELAAVQAKLAEEQKAKAEAEIKAVADAKAKAEADAVAAAAAVAKAEADAKLAADEKSRAEAEAQAALAAEAQAKAEADAKSAAEAQAKVEAEQKASAEAEAAKAAAAPVAEQLPVEPAASAEPVVAEPSPEVATAPVPPAPKPVVVPEPAAQPAPTEEVVEGKGLFSTEMIGGIVLVFLFIAGLFGYRKIAANRAERQAEEYDIADYGNDAQETAETESTDVAEQGYAEDNVESPEVVAPVVAAAATASALDDFDLDLDSDSALSPGASAAEDMDLDSLLAEAVAPAKKPAPAPAPVPAPAPADDDFDLDSLLADAAETAAQAPAVEHEEEILDLDSLLVDTGTSDADDEFNLDSLFDEEPETASSQVEELDLDALLETASINAVQETEPAVDEFELNLDFDDFDVDSAPVAAAPEPTPAPEQDDSDKTVRRADVAAFAAKPAPVEEEAPEEAAGEVSLDDLGLDFDLDFADSDTDIAADEDTAPSASNADTALLEAVSTNSSDMDEELDFLTDADEVATKLDLARAYIDMGDKEGARDILEEVLEEGGAEHKLEAERLMKGIGA